MLALCALSRITIEWANMDAEAETQVLCRFVTRMPEAYRVTSTAIAVPATLTRYGLSEVVNHLLNLGAPARSPCDGPCDACCRTRMWLYSTVAAAMRVRAGRAAAA